MADLLDNKNTGDYGDDAIVTLSPREHIRLRPGMYVGVVGLSLIHISEPTRLID